MFQPAGAGALVSAAAPSSVALLDDRHGGDRASSATAASTARRWARAGGTGTSVADGAATRATASRSRMPSSRSCSSGTCGSGRARQRIGAARHLRERDDLPDVRLARHERDEPLDPHREPAVRRRAHRERLEQERELLVAPPRRSSPSSGRRPAGRPGGGSGSSPSRAPSRSRSGRSAGSARSRDRRRRVPRARRSAP